MNFGYLALKYQKHIFQTFDPQLFSAIFSTFCVLVLVLTDDECEEDGHVNKEEEQHTNIKEDKDKYTNIMVEKVALNLPVVMTKRNNAKIIQVTYLFLGPDILYNLSVCHHKCLYVSLV